MTNKQRIIAVQKDTCNGLSGAYHDECAYGLAYRDGHGTIELFNRTFTNINTALTEAKEHVSIPGNCDEIIVVKLEVANPVAIVAPAEPVKPPTQVIMIGKGKR